MAIVVESSTVTTPTFNNPLIDCTISKPSGTVDGDFLVAIIFILANNDNSVTPPAGWTLIRNSSVFGGDTNSYYKVAASEGSSYVFDTVNTTNAGNVGGMIMRISGSAKVIQTSATASAANTTTPTFTDTVTPTYANSLLIFPIHQVTSSINSPTSNGHAIATSNPTWTIQQASGSSGLASGFGVATATRPETTATGNSSGTVGGDATADSVGQMIVLEPIQNATVNFGSTQPVGVTVNIQAPTVQQGQVASPSVVSAVVGIQAPSISKRIIPANTSKNNSTWTNKQKTQ